MDLLLPKTELTYDKMCSIRRNYLIIYHYKKKKSIHGLTKTDKIYCMFCTNSTNEISQSVYLIAKYQGF